MSKSRHLEAGEISSSSQQSNTEPEPLPSPLQSSPSHPHSHSYPAGLIGFDFDLTLSCFRVYGRAHFESLPTVFGGTERVALLRRYFVFLRQNSMRIIIISWNFEDIIQEALERLDLMQYVHSIYDREVMRKFGGYRHGKAGIVADICRRWHIELTRAVFVDDGREILQEMKCHTVWVKEAGMLLEHMHQAANMLGLDFSTTCCGT